VKTREFERLLVADGCVLHKKDGDHHIWRLPNGRLLLVPVGGKHSECKSYLKTRYKRLSREQSMVSAGVETPETVPSPWARTGSD